MKIRVYNMYGISKILDVSNFLVLDHVGLPNELDLVFSKFDLLPVLIEYIVAMFIHKVVFMV